MTTQTENKGQAILDAIDAAFAAGAKDEWDAPEFKLARDLTEQAGCQWDFMGWRDTAATIRNHGQLGGVALNMRRYKIREDSGASEIIEAESLEAALEVAREWASEGSYEQRVMVRVYADEIDEAGDMIPGEYASGEVAAGPEPVPDPTDCGFEDASHDWQSPIELVGGCRENPGVWSTGGTSFTYKTVCSRCGMYKIVRTSGAQRNAGELDESVEYEHADARSLAWVEAK